MTRSCGWCSAGDPVNPRCPQHGPNSPYRPPTLIGFDPTPIVLRLPFDRPPITSNEARSASSHWRGQHAAKHLVEHAVMVAVRAARVPRLDRLAATLTWYAPDYGIRDAGSLAIMMKACMDALTPPRAAIAKGTPTGRGTPRKRSQSAKIGAGIIVDDHAGIVPSETLCVVLGCSDARIELTLTPLRPSPSRERP